MDDVRSARAGRRRGPRRPGRRWRAAGCSLVASLVAAAVLPGTSSAAQAPHLSGANVFGWDFSFPDAVASDGGDVWVANAYAGTVVELDAATGALVRVLAGTTYRFSYPDAVVTDGTDVWVLNGSHGGITEFEAASGALVQTFSSTSPDFQFPNAMASDGTDLFVVCNNTDSLFEFSESTGALVREVAGSSHGLSEPQTVAVGGGHVWVGDSTGGVAELNESDGSLVQVIANAGASGIATDGTHVWTTDEGSNTVTELDESTGAVVATLTGPSYGFLGPIGVTSDGTDVWVANGDGRTIMELSAATGQRLKVVRVAGTGRSFLTSIGSDGTDLWVANGLADSVTEVAPSTGTVLRTVVGAGDGMLGPTSVLADGQYVWIGSQGSVTQLRQATGRLVRIIHVDARSSIFGLVRVGRYLWADASEAGLVQIDVPSGRVLQRISPEHRDLFLPDVITASDGRVWVGSQDFHYVASINATTGARTFRFDGAKHGFSPRALATDGRHLWIGNHSSVAELDEATGKLLRVITSSQLGMDDASELACSGGFLYVSGANASTVVVVRTATGAVVHRIRGWARTGERATAIAASQGLLWLSTSLDAVVELHTTGSASPTVLDGAPYAFDAPDAVSLSGAELWVANYYGDSVTELPTP